MNINVADILIKLRRKMGKTQKEVAKDTGISAVSLSAYENGRKEPLLSYAVRLASYYGVTLDSLCGIERDARQSKENQLLPLIVDLHDMMDGNLTAKVVDGRSIVSLQISQDGEWLADFVRNYNIVSAAAKRSGLDPEVLKAYKTFKFDEMSQLPEIKVDSL